MRRYLSRLARLTAPGKSLLCGSVGVSQSGAFLLAAALCTEGAPRTWPRSRREVDETGSGRAAFLFASGSCFFLPFSAFLGGASVVFGVSGLSTPDWPGRARSLAGVALGTAALAASLLGMWGWRFFLQE